MRVANWLKGPDVPGAPQKGEFHSHGGGNLHPCRIGIR
jgi:hypothetical protein